MNILEFINDTIREEKGVRVTIDSLISESELDSFGYTVLFLELDDKYGIFEDVPADADPFKTVNFATITVKEVIERCS